MATKELTFADVREGNESRKEEEWNDFHAYEPAGFADAVIQVSTDFNQMERKRRRQEAVDPAGPR